MSSFTSESQRTEYVFCDSLFCCIVSDDEVSMCVDACICVCVIVCVHLRVCVFRAYECIPDTLPITVVCKGKWR